MHIDIYLNCIYASYTAIDRLITLASYVYNIVSFVMLVTAILHNAQYDEYIDPLQSQ